MRACWSSVMVLRLCSGTHPSPVLVLDCQTPDVYAKNSRVVSPKRMSVSSLRVVGRPASAIREPRRAKGREKGPRR